MKKRLKIKVFGFVQGVFFRAGAKEMADSLSLAGLATNLADGSVGIIAEGEEENLKKLLSWAKRGPDLARVEKVDFFWQKPSGEFSDFQIK
jgi:acylphosphatase